LHIIEDIEVIILKKENKEKGVRHMLSTQTGLLLATGGPGTNPSFTGKMQDSKQKIKCEGHQGETHPQIVTRLCCLNPNVPLPPVVNSGKFLD
jgi:hypothetical protein